MGRKVLVIVLALLLAATAYAADRGAFYKIGSGQAVVTTPGTPVQLSATSQGCGVIYISRLVNVTHDTGLYLSNDIYVGGSNVNAGGRYGNTAMLTRKGIALKVSHDGTVMLPAADLNMVYIDSCHTNDGVTYTYLQ